MLKPEWVRFTLLLSLLIPGLAAAGEQLYRYVNDKGVVVLDRLGVPPEYIGKGYEVLSDQGRVVKVVPPAPTAAERQRMQADQARASSDAQLLRLYSTVDDVERARKRKLAELDGVIGVARGNLQSLRTQQSNLQGKAADHERAGHAVPPELLVQIDNLKAEQNNQQRDIERYQEARRQADVNFTADSARLAQLLGGKP